MRVKIHSAVSVSVSGSIPTLAGDGTAMPTDFDYDEAILTVVLSGGTSASLTLYGYINGVWGRLVDVGNVSAMLGGTTPLDTGVTYHFQLNGMGVCTRLHLVESADTGGVTETANLLFIMKI